MPPASRCTDSSRRHWAIRAVRNGACCSTSTIKRSHNGRLNCCAKSSRLNRWRQDGTWAKNPGKEWGCEVPLGKGDVGMENYLRTLAEIGYNGPLTIEREIPQEPERHKAEIGHAVGCSQS